MSAFDIVCIILVVAFSGFAIGCILMEIFKSKRSRLLISCIMSPIICGVASFGFYSFVRITLIDIPFVVVVVITIIGFVVTSFFTFGSLYWGTDERTLY